MSDKLSIALAIRNKNAKKMANGGSIKSEPLPMPKELDNDKKQAMQTASNEGKGMAPRPKLSPLKGPSMVKSDAFSTKLRTKESDLEDSIPPMKHEGMSETMSPSDEEILADHFANGGMIDDEMAHSIKPANIARPDGGYGAIIEKANGGMIDEDEEQHDSLAAAIMARRRKMSEPSGASDENDDQMYAEGGEVDLDLNAEERPNMMDSLNKSALKENYDEDMTDLTQPEDSNEHADSREMSSEDKMDKVSAIRRKMKSMR